MAQPHVFDAVLAHDDELVTGEAVALDLRPTSFVLSAAGAAIDFLVSLVFVLMVVLLASWSGLFSALDTASFQAALISLIVLATVVLPTAVETASRGRSLGRLAVGARIVRDDGGAIGFRHAFVRALTGVLEIFFTLGGLAALIGFLSPQSKRLGDLLAGTYSQHERLSRVSEPVWGVPVELTTWAQTADVARMPDRLSRRIGRYLADASKLQPASRRRVADELRAEARPYVNPMPDVDAELLLAAMAAVRRERELEAQRLQAARLEQLAPVLGGLPHGFPDR